VSVPCETLSLPDETSPVADATGPHPRRRTVHVEDEGFRIVRELQDNNGRDVLDELARTSRITDTGLPVPLLAALLARTAHAGQTDRQGRDYWEFHLWPVVTRLRAVGADEVELAAGWLHDVIEDTDYTAAALRTAGVPEGVVEIVEVMTRRPDETYQEYIKRVARHPRARQVKLADNAVNLGGLDDLAALGPAHAAEANRLRPRYVRARATLVAAEIAATPSR
jgi:(p)ppGpp synthase/HD superfamily hydrolase